MIGRIVSISLAWLGTWTLSMQPASAAEIFFMDRDAFTNEYVGPVGPPVLSGEIIPGDYERLLAKIAEDQNRFLSQNKLILASSQGNAEEAMKIARLVKSLYTEVIVAPLAGRCAGACFLIYAAAAERGTDGENLLGLSRPGLAESEWAAMPTAQAALLEDAMQAPVRMFLNDNEVPPDIVEEMFKRPPTDIYWLSEQQETALSPKSPAFTKLLADKCGWNDGLERAVYHGERPVDDLKELSACRLRTTQPEARKALAQALKDAKPKDVQPKDAQPKDAQLVDAKLKDAKPTKAASAPAANATPAAKRRAAKKKAAKKDSVSQSSTTRGK